MFCVGVVGTTFEALLTTFKKEYEVAELWRTPLSDHVIICGQSDECRRLGSEMIRHGKQVVMLVGEEGSIRNRAELDRIESQGAYVLRGVDADTRVLALAQLKTAAMVFAFAEQQDLNIRCAL